MRFKACRFEFVNEVRRCFDPRLGRNYRSVYGKGANLALRGISSGNSGHETGCMVLHICLGTIGCEVSSRPSIDCYSQNYWLIKLLRNIILYSSPYSDINWFSRFSHFLLRFSYFVFEVWRERERDRDRDRQTYREIWKIYTYLLLLFAVFRFYLFH